VNTSACSKTGDLTSDVKPYWAMARVRVRSMWLNRRDCGGITSRRPRRGCVGGVLAAAEGLGAGLAAAAASEVVTAAAVAEVLEVSADAVAEVLPLAPLHFSGHLGGRLTKRAGAAVTLGSATAAAVVAVPDRAKSCLDVAVAVRRVLPFSAAAAESALRVARKAMREVARESMGVRRSCCSCWGRREKKWGARAGLANSGVAAVL